MELEWNVYIEDWNTRNIELFNIFRHFSFNKSVKKIMEIKGWERDEFAEKIRGNLQYFFWSKCEYEVVVTSWPPYIKRGEYDRIEEEMMNRTCENIDSFINIRPCVTKKVDVYDQVMLNFDIFIDYLWSKRGDVNE